MVGSNPARVETIFLTISTPSSYLTCPGLNISEQRGLGDRLWNQVYMGDL